MKKGSKYRESDRMCDLIESDDRVLVIMSRLGVPLGVGDRTIGEVCADSGVDLHTFLVVVNTTVLDIDPTPAELARVCWPALTRGLAHTHSYYQHSRLPWIRRKLIESWGGSDRDLLTAVLNYFDEFVADVCRDVEFEERVFFPYIDALSRGEARSRPDWRRTIHSHEAISIRLRELSRLLVRYYPAQNIDRMNLVLFNLRRCEYALRLHHMVEERLLFPIVGAMERARDLSTVSAK